MKRFVRTPAWFAIALAVSLVACFQQSVPDGTARVPERVRYSLEPSLASRSTASGNGLTLTFTKTADWDAGSGVRGFTADITIANGTGSQLHEWDLIFSFLHPITGMWNASFARDDIEYTVTPDGWNATLDDGQARSFGFQGTYSEVFQEPTAYVVSGIPVGDQSPPVPVTPTCTLVTSFAVTSEWPAGGGTRGFVAEVLLQNAGSDPVNWEITFDLDAVITNMWNASFLAHGDGYRVTPEPWNVRLEPGQTRSFGFQGTFQGAAGSLVGPSNVVCNGQEGNDLPAIQLWKEAERTQTLRPALIVSMFNSDPVSASALCGAYVGVPVGDDGTVVGRASYAFDVAREGRYYLWARVMTLSGAPQSNLGVTVDGVDVGTWELGADPDWRWAALGDHQATPGMHLASGERHLELVFQTPGTNVDSLLLTSDALFDPAPKGNPNCDNSWVEAWNQRKTEVYAALTPDERYLADAGRTAFNGDIFAPVSPVRALANSNQSRIRAALAPGDLRSFSHQDPTYFVCPLERAGGDDRNTPRNAVDTDRGTFHVIGAAVASRNYASVSLRLPHHEGPDYSVEDPDRDVPYVMLGAWSISGNAVDLGFQGGRRGWALMSNLFNGEPVDGQSDAHEGHTFRLQRRDGSCCGPLYVSLEMWIEDEEGVPGYVVGVATAGPDSVWRHPETGEELDVIVIGTDLHRRRVRGLSGAQVSNNRLKFEINMATRYGDPSAGNYVRGIRVYDMHAGYRDANGVVTAEPWDADPSSGGLTEFVTTCPSGQGTFGGPSDAYAFGGGSTTATDPANGYAVDIDITIDDIHEGPDADSDGDGITNAEERINGTDPYRPPCSLVSAGHPCDPNDTRGGPTTGDGRYSGTLGDPHIVTPDDLRYSFQAAGDYLLTRSTNPGDTFEVQIRYAPFESNGRQWSGENALAMIVGFDKVELYPQVGGAVEVVLNEVPVTVTHGDIVALPGGGTMSNTGDLLFVNWPDGTFVEASLNSPDPGREVRGFTRIWFPGFRRGLVEGLLGDFDGTAANDLRIRGGAVLTNPTEQDLYTGGFRDSWSIQGGAAVSLFSRGTDPYDPAWPDRVIDPNEFPAQAWDAATQICRDEGLTDFWLVRVCAIDVLTTGNPAWASTAADAAFGLDPLIIGVAIHPRAAAVNSSQQVVFTAIVGGITDEVVWSASGGAINGDGDTIVFTPPATEGRYSVTATLASDPTVTATAQIDVIGLFLPMSTPGTPSRVTGR